MTDVIIIGGGAAGCMAAVQAARLGKSVIVFEKNDRLGRKLRITGKGRCNVTNNSPVEVHLNNIPVNSRFLYSSFAGFDSADVMNFFEELGVPLKTERGNRVFPVSDKADDIADALAYEMKTLGLKSLTSVFQHLLSRKMSASELSPERKNSVPLQRLLPAEENPIPIQVQRGTDILLRNLPDTLSQSLNRALCLLCHRINSALK